MKWRVAINGYGRIGQSILRALYQSDLRDSFDIVAINELADIDTIAYLTKYDTTHGRFRYPVSVDGDALLIDGDRIGVSNFQNLNELPWRDIGVDVVFECTGEFSTRDSGQAHLDAGARFVLFSQPGDNSLDNTIVYGVNHLSLVASDKVVSNASCTTNAIVPVLQMLDESFGIVSGAMTTIHSAMNDQPTIDAYHHKDLRRTRSAMANMVPVETALAKGVERLLPSMQDKLTAVAMRVPTINVSAIDLTVVVNEPVTLERVNSVLRAGCIAQYHGAIAYTEEPIASSDFIQDPHSSTVDGSQTRVSKNNLVKVLVWFDNEWGFANRMLEVAEHWCRNFLKP